MIYLDNAATTKPLQKAVLAAEKYTKDYFYNPSALYRGGITVKKDIEDARNVILKSFSPSGYDLIFTSCGSEADTTAIFAFAKKGNIITTEGEHSAVYKCYEELKKRGYDVRYAKLNQDGSVNVDSLLSLVDDKTSLVSVVHVNNETGAINDINAISTAIKAKNKYTVFHSDGVQAYMKIPFKPCRNIDLYSVSAHKIGALKGVGALFKKKTLVLNPLIYGGGQENGLRSGTENVFGIMVFKEAVQERANNVLKYYQNAEECTKAFKKNLDSDYIKIISGENSSPFILSLSAKALKGEVIQHMLEDEGVVIGTGSACSSRNPYSRIISACGYNSDVLSGVIRISFGYDTTMEECETASEKLTGCVKKLYKVMYNK